MVVLTKKLLQSMFNHYLWYEKSHRLNLAKNHQCFEQGDFLGFEQRVILT